MNNINISPLRLIVEELLNERASYIKKEMRVLEIGCGSIDFFKKIVESKGAHWYGVDPKGNLAIHRGTVSKLSFDADYFDLVVCSQSIEHWYEFMTTFDQGLSEIHRVMKNEALLFLDAPLYLHGHAYFMLGKKSKITKLFSMDSWFVESEKIIDTPKPYYTWNGTRKKYALEYIYEKYLKIKQKDAKIYSVSLRKKQAEYKTQYPKLLLVFSLSFYFLISCYVRGRSYLNFRLNRNKRDVR